MGVTRVLEREEARRGAWIWLIRSNQPIRVLREEAQRGIWIWPIRNNQPIPTPSSVLLFLLYTPLWRGRLRSTRLPTERHVSPEKSSATLAIRSVVRDRSTLFLSFFANRPFKFFYSNPQSTIFCKTSPPTHTLPASPTPPRASPLP